MSSPSNQSGASASDAPALLGREMRRREVLRLEFHTLGQRHEDVAGVKVEAIETDAERLLREELAALNERMRAQSETAAVQMEEARREERASAREEWELELLARVDEERNAVARVCEAFQQERAKYFASVEAEVVKLALAIVARILHREVKLDALLLSAAVRVALEKVAEGSEVSLRVPTENVEAWRGVVGTDVELVGDGGLDVGECVLETKVGRVELGVSAQLAEIERGFFDLLQKRPV